MALDLSVSDSYGASSDVRSAPFPILTIGTAARATHADPARAQLAHAGARTRAAPRWGSPLLPPGGQPGDRTSVLERKRRPDLPLHPSPTSSRLARAARRQALAAMSPELGMDPREAVRTVRAARPGAIETDAQVAAVLRVKPICDDESEDPGARTKPSRSTIRDGGAWESRRASEHARADADAQAAAGEALGSLRAHPALRRK